MPICRRKLATTWKPFGEILTFKYEGAGPARREKLRQGHTGSRKPRNTCLKCNGGWMSRLEQANIYTLSRLITGKSCLITPIDQWLLASLFCLITIRLEFTDVQMQGVPREDRFTLMLRGHPPFKTWRIWIAQYIGANPEDHWGRHFGLQMVSSPDDAPRPHKCNTQVTTMVIGKLCFHAVSSSVMGVPQGYEGVDIHQIWPTSNFDIDSRSLPVLDEAQVIHLHEALPASLKVVAPSRPPGYAR
ncbi:hypothetical protein ACVWWO_000971 [Bradyrhizobium sp. F1.13.1]